METPEGVEIRQELAGAGSRAAAALVDVLLFAVGAAVIGLALLALGAFGGSAGRFVLGLYVGGIVLLWVGSTYAWHAATNGRSPGKMLVGVRVASADGSPATNVQHLLRALILIVDVLPLPAPLGLVLAAATPRHTRLGDLAAGTIVLRTAQLESALEPWAGETHSALAVKQLAIGPDAARALDPRDVAFLRDLATRRGLEDGAQRALIARTADVYCAKLGIARPASVDPSAAVRELYLYAREHASHDVARS